MKYLIPGLLVVGLCTGLPEGATAQRQARFSSWAGATPAVQSSRAPGVQLPDSVRQKVGYQHWKGAAIGAGVGAVLGSVLAFGLSDKCADCTLTTWDRTQAVVLITGASTALGFLVGLASPKYAWTPARDTLDGE